MDLTHYLISINYKVGLVILAISLFASIVILRHFDRLPETVKLFGIYFIVSAGVEVISTSLSFNSANNLFMFHIYSVLEYWFLLLFFHRCALKFGQPFNLWLLLIPGLCLIILNSVFLQPLNTFNSNTAPLVSFTVLLLSFRFLFSIMETELNSELKTLKIIIICLLIYSGTTLIVLLFSNDLLHIDREKQLVIWLTRSVLQLGVKIVLAITFVKLFYSPQNKLA